MSTTTSIETRAIDYAAAVRGQLADLSADEIDDLTDGLEADLADRLADGGELEDAECYAEELRQAAGLPSRSETAAETTKRRVTMRETVNGLRERLALFWDAGPGRRAVRDFAVALRPVWWVLRGLVFAWLALGLIGHPMVNGLPMSFAGMLVAAVTVVLSVQWGRGRWAPTRWLVWVRRIANAAALVLIVPMFGSAWIGLSTTQYVDYGVPYSEGLGSNGGEPIGNIFAYGCNGELLDGVRLFDQNGNPLTTLSSYGEPMTVWSEKEQQNLYFERNSLADGNGEWNAFPLREGIEDPYNFGGLPDRFVDGTAPKTELPPLSHDCPAPVSDDATGETTESGSAAAKDAARGNSADGSSAGRAEHAE